MVVVDIEYCIESELLEPAIEIQRALLSEYGAELDGVRLSPGEDGVFTVSVGRRRVFDKDDHGAEIDLGIVTDVIEKRAARTA